MDRRHFLLALLVALAPACLTEASDKGAETVRAEDCARARDHLVDLRLAGTDALGKTEQEKHRTVLVAALGTQFMDSCIATLSEPQVACLQAAGDADDVNACNPAARGN